MNNQESWIIIARFGRPHGVKGFITVHSFTEPRDNVLKYTDWHMFICNKWQVVPLLRAEAKNKSIIAQIEGYCERESVAQLTNVDIAVHQDQLEKLRSGEYYWYQLIGMDVINSKGEIFGKVTEIIPTGSNDVLAVEGNKKYLIPYLPGQFVLKIDSDQQVITVNWDVDF